MHNKSTEWMPRNHEHTIAGTPPRARKPWQAPSLVIIDIEEETGNSASTGTDGKGGGETGVTAS